MMILMIAVMMMMMTMLTNDDDDNGGDDTDDDVDYVGHVFLCCRSSSSYGRITLNGGDSSSKLDLSIGWLLLLQRAAARLGALSCLW